MLNLGLSYYIKMSIRICLLLFLVSSVTAASSILVKDGIYSRVTVQIEPQTQQPENCVGFLDQLEVS